MYLFFLERVKKKESFLFTNIVSFAFFDSFLQCTHSGQPFTLAIAFCLTASAILMHSNTDTYGLKRIPDEELSYPEDYLLLHVIIDDTEDERDEEELYLPVEADNEEKKEDNSIASNEVQDDNVTEGTPLITHSLNV